MSSGLGSYVTNDIKCNVKREEFENSKVLLKLSDINLEHGKGEFSSIQFS